MSQPWPPPPDLDSIRELVRDADIERFIADEGAPADEYDTEADALYAAIANRPSSEITPATLFPFLQEIWRGSFASTEADLVDRLPALHSLAVQVTRFFGPQAEPLVRT